MEKDYRKSMIRFVCQRRADVVLSRLCGLRVQKGKNT